MKVQISLREEGFCTLVNMIGQNREWKRKSGETMSSVQPRAPHNHILLLDPLQQRPLSDISLAVLSLQMQHQLERYRRGEEADSSYCGELFYRAITKYDHEAWEIWQLRMSPIVNHWIYRHPQHELALRLDTAENYVALTFARTWLSTSKRHLLLDTHNAVMGYLHACLNSTIMDALRTHLRSTVISLPESGYMEEMIVEDTYHEHDLWEVIQSLLPDQRERRVAYLLYHCGLKAREILQHCPEEFQDVKEIYRLRRKIIERLERSADRIRWKLSEQEQ